MSSQDYFATRSARDVVGHLTESRETWNQSVIRMGLRERQKKSFSLYYGKHFSQQDASGGSGVLRAGSQGELAMFAVNHYRNLIKHTLALTCNQKPAFDARAINTDSDSLNQARLANNITESDWQFKQLGEVMKRAAEMSQVMGKGYVFSRWNTVKGKPHTVKPVLKPSGEPHLDEEGQPKMSLVYEGDVEDTTPSALDVFTDPGLDDHRKTQWQDIRSFENKWDLAAQYPAMADKIKGLSTRDEMDSLKNISVSGNDQATTQTPVYYFFHKRTLALPNGRLIMYCDQEVILFDGPCPPPYDKCLPAFRIVPGEVFGTTEGYTDAFDLHGIQEAVNTLFSIGFTNIQANGIQKIWIPEGANVSSTTLSKGLAVIRTQPGMKPEPLQLTANPADLYKGIESLIKSMETVSGINSVARGDPEHSLKSGIALAYVQAMAAQYTSTFQESWVRLNEEVASFRIKLYQEYAGTERLCAMAGKRNRGYMSSFTGEKLKKVDRITVEIGNPVTKTLGGRLEVASQMKDMGMFKTPQDFLTFIESGQLDTMTEDGYDANAWIRQENEMLMEGKPVKAITGEPHLLHMQKHFAQMSNPQVKTSDPMVSNHVEHIMDHLNLYRTQDPIWSQLAGEPPAPPPPMPPGPPGMPPGGPGPMAGPPPGPMGPPHPPGPPMPPMGGPMGPPPPMGGHPPMHHPHPPENPMEKMGQSMQPESPLSHIPRLPGHLQPGMNQP